MTTSSPSFPGIWSFYGEAFLLIKKYWKIFTMLMALNVSLSLLSLQILMPQLLSVLTITQEMKLAKDPEVIQSLALQLIQIYPSLLIHLLPLFFLGTALGMVIYFQGSRVVAIEKTGKDRQYFEGFWSWFGAGILACVGVLIFCAVFIIAMLILNIGVSLFHNQYINFIAIFILFLLFIGSSIFSYLFVMIATLLPLLKGVGPLLACKKSLKIIGAQWKFALWKSLLFILTVIVVYGAWMIIQFLMRLPTFLLKNNISTMLSVESIGLILIASIATFFVILTLYLAMNLFATAMIKRGEKLGVKIS